jgi:hypothetical protein
MSSTVTSKYRLAKKKKKNKQTSNYSHVLLDYYSLENTPLNGNNFGENKIKNKRIKIAHLVVSMKGKVAIR